MRSAQRCTTRAGSPADRRARRPASLPSPRHPPARTSESASPASCWRAQSLKLDRNPWPDAATRRRVFHDACVITCSPAAPPDASWSRLRGEDSYHVKYRHGSSPVWAPPSARALSAYGKPSPQAVSAIRVTIVGAWRAPLARTGVSVLCCRVPHGTGQLAISRDTLRPSTATCRITPRCRIRHATEHRRASLPAISPRSRTHLRALPGVPYDPPHFLPAPTGAATLDRPVLVRTRGAAPQRLNRGTRTRLRRVKTRQVPVTRSVAGAAAASGTATSAQARPGATLRRAQRRLALNRFPAGHGDVPDRRQPPRGAAQPPGPPGPRSDPATVRQEATHTSRGSQPAKSSRRFQQHTVRATSP